ncbi:transmembrane proteins 14C-domain-containing protein [Lipomyces oligophaga]|uniref:transmembrane proteins 14C-domain-containing protein n=1 Tax=Lipomyces oligophaga TaxID=45792 RepID=UPI0034D01481
MEHPAFTLSALCSIGGIMGYVRKGSRPSLFGGLGVGLLYGVSGYLLSQNHEGGIQTALAASLILASAGASRTIKTRKPVPIALFLLGTVSTAYYSKKYYDFYLA